MREHLNFRTLCVLLVAIIGLIHSPHVFAEVSYADIWTVNDGSFYGYVYYNDNGPVTVYYDGNYLTTLSSQSAPFPWGAYISGNISTGTHYLTFFDCFNVQSTYVKELTCDF